MELDDADRAIINAYQGGFPVVEDPFVPVSRRFRNNGVDLSPDGVVEKLRRLDEEGVISRFGALINADAIGGTTVLVATTVPEEEFEDVVETINSHDEVAHNYERDHFLNVWFVVSVADKGSVEDVLDEIEEETGVETYTFPKLHEFHLGARFPVDGPFYDSPAEPKPQEPEATELEPDEDELLAEIHDGFPITRHPYSDIAEALGAETRGVVSAIRRLSREGKIRRVGVVPNHYAVGYTENAMTVWDVPDEYVVETGESVGSLPFVTHCYERPRHRDVWRYNLFAMVHGRSTKELDDSVESVREAVKDATGGAYRDQDRLVSRRVLKKTGINLQRGDG